MTDTLDFPAADVAEEAAREAEPTEASKAIAALGLTRMTLQELKEKSPADLVAFAEQFDIENANAMRKQDMMFAILKTLADEGVEISASRHAGSGAGRLRLPAQS